MTDVRQNPFKEYDPETGRMWWKWIDETGDIHHKRYDNQLDALYDLLKYIKYLNHGPTFWQRLWWPVRYRFWPMLVRVWHA